MTNISLFENVSGLDAVAALNASANGWPLLMVALVVAVIIFSVARRVTDPPESMFAACLLFTILAGTFAVAGVGSWVPVGIGGALAVFTAIMAVNKNKPNTL